MEDHSYLLSLGIFSFFLDFRVKDITDDDFLNISTEVLGPLYLSISG